MSPWLNHSLSGYFVFFMIKLQGHNEIAHAFQIYFVSLYRNLEFHFLSLFANQDPQVKTHTHTHPVLFQRYKATSMCVCSVARSCLTLWESVDCSLPVSSVHGILQTGILEWVAISTSKGSSHPGIDQESPASPILAGAFLITEPLGSPIMQHTILFITADFFQLIANPPNRNLEVFFPVLDLFMWFWLRASCQAGPVSGLLSSIYTLADLLLYMCHICDYWPLALQPSPTRGSQQSGVFSFPIQSVDCSEVFYCLFVLLGGLWMGDWGCIFHTKYCHIISVKNFFFGPVMWLFGSQFPSQDLNPGPGNESAES